ncbi:metallophosphoesterase [Bacillus songklensis]|uniref:Metallophosphoesterase n=1 Tax=Bacillus songklensis TaxID=1069116 RepID=A0ABV8AXN9_9BACI
MEFFVLLFFFLIGLIFYMFAQAKRNKVVEHHLAFKEFPSTFGEVRIFFISDIHRRHVSKKLLEQVKRKVDFVVMGGDIIEKGVPFERVRENLRTLKKLGPLYFVWGNNDYEVDFHQLDALLLEENVKILDNTSALFESEEGEMLELLGVDDVSKNRAHLHLALADSQPGSFKILISHNPSVHKKVKKEDGIALMLSGHTHGGQIRLFGFGPYEKGGIKSLEHTTLFVSNGYGTTGVPFRLGVPAEAHVIVITGEK